MRPRAGAWLLPALSVFGLVGAGAAAAPTTIEREGYTATVDDLGRLVSLRVGDAELLAGPLALCPGVEWTSAEVEGSGHDGSIRAVLASDKGQAELSYECEPQRLVATLRHQLGGYQSWEVVFGDAVAAAENLQDNTVSGAEAIQYLDRGEIRPAPWVRLSRVQRARLHLANGATVMFWHDGWGAPFNIDEIGSFAEHTYRRNLLENDRPMRVYFQLERPPTRPTAVGPAFVARAHAFAGMYGAGEPVRFDITFTQSTVQRLALADNWRMAWTVGDFWGREVDRGKLAFARAAAEEAGSLAVELPVEQPGWFSVLFSLRPVGEDDILPSDFRIRFAVVRPDAGLPEAPDREQPVSDYAFAALLGMRCIRESHEMRGFFPERGKANWEALDEVFNRADTESRRWGVSWFFQANARPDWCSEADYEQIAYELVSRFRDRCAVWEVENEPNFGYSPEDYVCRALLPFAKGAKRADPACQIIGPACVSVPETLRFMSAVRDLNALSYLDGIATHTYVGPGEPWELYGNPDYLHTLQELAPGTPLWQTEQGYSWGHVSKQEHARYVVRQFLNGFAAGITAERHYYFYPVHHGFEPWYLVESGSSAGLDGTLEPAAVALRAMHEQIGDRECGERQSPTFGVYALRFTGQDTDVVALWTLDFTLDLRVKTRVLSAFDIMGKGIPLRSNGPITTLPLSGYPTYLHVPRGEPLELASPLLGTNLAAAAGSATASASTCAEDHPPEHAIDGRWSLRDPTEGMAPRTYWEDLTEGASVARPDWLQVTLPEARRISRVLVLTPLPAIDAVPRDFAIETSTDGQTWRVAAQRRDQVAWAHLVEFSPLRAKHVRLTVTAVNDGWHLDGRWMPMVGEGFTRYTSLRTQVLELMVFGPSD